jgi:hypothetical protein
MAEGKANANPDLYALVGRAMVDHDFREMVMDPARRKDALYAMNIEPTDEVMDAMDKATSALGDLNGAFGHPNAAA